MVKLIAFFKRLPGTSVEHFQSHWRTRHAELVVRQAGLRRYVQNHVLPGAYRHGEPFADGVAEAWFDDVDAMRRLAPSPEYAAVRADEANFLDVRSMGVVLADERCVLDGVPPPGAVKSIIFLRKRADLTPDAFRRYWAEQHGPLAVRVPGQRRYVQCPARAGGYGAGRAPVFDGVALAWFDDTAALRTAAASPELAAMRADEPAFVAPGDLPQVFASELDIACGGRDAGR